MNKKLTDYILGGLSSMGLFFIIIQLMIETEQKLTYLYSGYILFASLIIFVLITEVLCRKLEMDKSFNVAFRGVSMILILLMLTFYTGSLVLYSG